jgi:hypothetical protein
MRSQNIKTTVERKKKLVFKWGKLTFSFNDITKPFVLVIFKEREKQQRDDKKKHFGSECVDIKLGDFERINERKIKSHRGVCDEILLETEWKTF